MQDTIQKAPDSLPISPSPHHPSLQSLSLQLERSNRILLIGVAYKLDAIVRSRDGNTTRDPLVVAFQLRFAAALESLVIDLGPAGLDRIGNRQTDNSKRVRLHVCNS